MIEEIFEFTADFERKEFEFCINDEENNSRRILYDNNGKIMNIKKNGNNFFQGFNIDNKPIYILVMYSNSSNFVRLYKIKNISFIRNKIISNIIGSMTCYAVEEYVDSLKDEEVRKDIFEKEMNIGRAIREYISIFKTL